ncbi:MAG: hypothetical protein A2268_14655 [Candidatus Raymondbacteria bacterium RifOxyA12_full_50_37]|uniref:HTH tetR-type domain-containing protein n=1 Tax=Candidatus Raymondbacteria bacterium RIFOXYD12_FULL_49_13 TaxID=1817890 RepID=A0A1F7F2P6_UNCRA|nr:MAG: hypothetical protein A2268_14655 [Candidatus Raymondbacteria bacterium RifOxyA12_full_50_37]OGJ87806.1 MAG: hypothetical protein A2350_12600 [Candidatus Raymondbacteria bacterium RifOxyB12_full_50_8]OGJ88660.1 MAG: hypothetical protein A2248_20590 [Candidatus Raymondbacteria bacterium RIFOXYA2_FULL_49_16]OGK00832.1 MAG: hypothetical protein A2519_07845 [Candidatus Raymondbacteria bacterium RIFOXYD12_FULL_49_13]OGK02865.1 MAG: hypothetical protein A2487_17715 [Candidatus Raymondbacteria 
MKSLSPRQQEIIQASFTIVRKKGIKGLTTKELAKSLEITEPALYRHFKNKTDIVYAILCRMESDNKQMRTAFINSAMPALDKLEAMYVSTMGILAKNPVLATVMLSEEHYLENKKLMAKALAIQDGTLATIGSILTQGVKKKQVRNDISGKELGLMIMGTMRLVAIRWRLSGYQTDLTALVKRSWHSLKITLRVIRSHP